MKKVIAFGTLAFSLVAAPAFAHHPAEDIVDEEIYAMIDSMVADTPHATLDFDEMGGGMTETTITTDSAADLQDIIDDENLLEYVERLGGDVSVEIDFNQDGSVSMTINQVN